MNNKNEVPLLNKIRYCLFMPVLLVIALITCPLTLLGWNGFHILCTAIYYWCSFSKAKRLFLENEDEKCAITYDNTSSSNISDDSVSISSLKSSYENDIVANPTYSSLSCNIHHRNY